MSPMLTRSVSEGETSDPVLITPRSGGDEDSDRVIGRHVPNVRPVRSAAAAGHGGGVGISQRNPSPTKSTAPLTRKSQVSQSEDVSAGGGSASGSRSGDMTVSGESGRHETEGANSGPVAAGRGSAGGAAGVA